MGYGSRGHRIKLQYGKGKKYVSGAANYSSEDDELVHKHGGGFNKFNDKNGISETVITINNRLQNAPTHRSASKPWTICRAPPKLRRLHEHGFNPTLVSIGPIHRFEGKHLSFMEGHKLRFLRRLLDKMTLPDVDDVQQENVILDKTERKPVDQEQSADQSASSSTSSSNANANEKKLEYLVVAMKELEAYTRTCYSTSYDFFPSNEFVMMMILDSCFVVELLRLYAKWGFEKVDEPLFKTRWVVPTLKHDLLMLENQLPLAVLKKMFKISHSWEDRFTFKAITLKFFNSLLTREKAFSGMCIVDNKPDHLLGLFRSSFQVRPIRRFPGAIDGWSRLRFWARLPLRGIHFAIRNMKTCLRIRQTDDFEQDPSPPWVHERKLLIHCVTELKEAGISFKKRENHELLDIAFKNGKLYIPPLLIDDYTGLMFLNFVAYEQCNPSSEPYFTTYLLFWDSLLNSAEDVEYLHSKGIIDHVLGSDEDVAQLFNKLCREVAHDLGDCYLSKVLQDVNLYFGVRRHRWRAKWKHDYFSSPWAFLSLIAAVFLLILTSIQTIFSVFSYVLPRS